MKGSRSLVGVVFPFAVFLVFVSLAECTTWTFINAAPAWQGANLYFNGRLHAYVHWGNWITKNNPLLYGKAHVEVKYAYEPAWFPGLNMNYTFLEEGHYVIIFYGSSPDVFAGVHLEIFRYYPEYIADGVARIAFFHACVTGTPFGLDVTNEIPGQYNFPNVAYGALATYPQPYLDIKAGTYNNILFSAWISAKNIMPIMTTSHTFTEKTATLIISAGMLGDDSYLQENSMFVPLV